MSGKQNELDDLMTVEEYLHWMDLHISKMIPEIIPGFKQPLKDWINISYRWARYEEVVLDQNKELPNG